MPDRRHLWRGIHDPDTVREGIRLEVAHAPSGGDSTTVEIHVQNVGAAHNLPTYVTPKIFVRARLLDESGVPIPGTDAERAIGWEVVLTSAERRKVFGTRIPAGGEWVWRYAVPLRPKAEAIDVRLDVHPDHCYIGFFESYPRSGLSPAAAAMIDSAEAHARHSSYRLLQEQWPLDGLTGSRDAR
jgi:hypothetical protein